MEMETMNPACRPIRFSKEVDKIVPALIKIQSELPSFRRDTEGQEGHRKFSYAPLDTILPTVKEVSTKHGCGILYGLSGGAAVACLLHESGQWARVEMPAPQAKTAREEGKVVTYFRRYLLGCLLNIVLEGDLDSEPGKASVPGSAPPKAAGWSPPQRSPGTPATPPPAASPAGSQRGVILRAEEETSVSPVRYKEELERCLAAIEPTTEIRKWLINQLTATEQRPQGYDAFYKDGFKPGAAFYKWRDLAAFSADGGDGVPFGAKARKWALAQGENASQKAHQGTAAGSEGKPWENEGDSGFAPQPNEPPGGFDEDDDIPF
jgi:hypothetical protein